MVGTNLIQKLGRATTEPARFGGKAAGLGRLIDLGHRVPAGFAVAAEALPMAIEAHGLSEDYRTLDESMRNGSPDTARAGRIHDVILRQPVPEELMAEVHAAASGLDGANLIVRSSAASEDSSAHSYAGIFESTPVGRDRIADGIRTVWASVFTPRAVSYAVHAGLGHVPHMGVVVQRFIEAERSGVMFTSYPGPDGADNTLVEHVAGTAERLVRGEVTPSRSWLRSAGEDRGDLGDACAAELARLAMALEEQFGGPQDVEWCVLDAELHVVQTRPVTAIISASAAVAGAVDDADDLVLLRGTPASPGAGVGPVHVAFNVEQALALASGDVLVTPMTNPDMVVAMRNAAAIVTDVGGMICHAAIVSRELQLPCVVGTGTGTEVLTSGDAVTVDGGLGVVFEGEVVRKAASSGPASVDDIWALFPSEPAVHVIPLVSTVELLRHAPPEITSIAYLVDIDIRCDERGLWRPGESDEVLRGALDRVLKLVVEASPRLKHIHVLSAGAVSSDELAAGIDRVGSNRLVSANGLNVAWEGGVADGSALTAVPLGAFGAHASTHREALPPVDQSIARSLDPSNGPGPVPQVRPAPMPDSDWRRRWWERLRGVRSIPP